jgi:hypothetical protein
MLCSLFLLCPFCYFFAYRSRRFTNSACLFPSAKCPPHPVSRSLHSSRNKRVLCREAIGNAFLFSYFRSNQCLFSTLRLCWSIKSSWRTNMPWTVHCGAMSRERGTLPHTWMRGIAIRSEFTSCEMCLNSSFQSMTPYILLSFPFVNSRSFSLYICTKKLQEKLDFGVRLFSASQNAHKLLFVRGIRAFWMSSSNTHEASLVLASGFGAAPKLRFNVFDELFAFVLLFCVFNHSHFFLHFSLAFSHGCSESPRFALLT